jgi:endonuclease/exonuclease/phosphatase family metal-dependent hydrolase
VAAYAQGEIRVAAWNVQGVTFSSSGRPQPVPKSERLAQAIKIIRPDVIALSEVNSETELRRLITKLGNEGLIYRYTMLASQQPVAQKIAILFRQGISVSNQRLIPDSNAGSSSLRKALSAQFKSGGFDFLLVAVHLKSGRENAERKTRTRQNRAIRTFIEARAQATGEQDVLVVGDYNMIPDKDQVNFEALSPAAGGLLRFVSSEEFGLPGGGFQTSHIGSCAGGRPAGNLLDGFAIARAGTQREYVADSAEILPLHNLLGIGCADYKARFSDHLPLVARFTTDPPDDDN